jgi:hypothetical protein
MTETNEDIDRLLVGTIGLSMLAAATARLAQVMPEDRAQWSSLIMRAMIHTIDVGSQHKPDVGVVQLRDLCNEHLAKTKK